MSLKYLYKGEYFSRLADVYADYGAWSESCSGAGGLPSDESIELFLDCLTANNIEIHDNKICVPKFDPPRLSKKYYANYIGNKDTQLLNYQSEIYDGFITTFFDTEAEIEDTLSSIKSGKTLIFVLYSTPYAIRYFGDNKNEIFYEKLGVEKTIFSQNLHSQKYGFGKVLFVHGSFISDNALHYANVKKSTDTLFT